MAPLPKRKRSKSRQGTRMAHAGITPKNMGPCSDCGRPKLSHRACPHCGQYNGRQAIQASSAEE